MCIRVNVGEDGDDAVSHRRMRREGQGFYGKLRKKQAEADDGDDFGGNEDDTDGNDNEADDGNDYDDSDDVVSHRRMRREGQGCFPIQGKLRKRTSRSC